MEQVDLETMSLLQSHLYQLGEQNDEQESSFRIPCSHPIDPDKTVDDTANVNPEEEEEENQEIDEEEEEEEVEAEYTA